MILRVVVIPLAAAGLCFAGVRLEPRLVAFDLDPRIYIAALAAGGVLAALWAGSTVRELSLGDRGPCGLVAFALLLPVWGMLPAPLCGGLLGALHACFFGVALWLATDDAHWGVAPLPAIVVAWAIATFAFLALGAEQLHAWFVLVILIWNAVMSLWTEVVVRLRRVEVMRWLSTNCWRCGYPQDGLPTRTCPECGADQRRAPHVKPFPV